MVKFDKKTMKAIVLLIVSVVTAAMVLCTVRDLWAVHARLVALVQAWEADGPPSTVLGRLRDRLAAFAWLGPLRPGAPRDPFRECGIPPAGDGWWSYLWRLVVARRRMACLEDLMAKALVEHRRWEEKLVGLAITTACFMVRLSLFSASRADARAVSAVKEKERQAAVVVPRDGAGCSPPRRLVKEKAAVTLLRGVRRWQRKMTRRTPRDERREQLQEAIEASLHRQLRKDAQEVLHHDALDWWRCSDDGRGKLVLQPQEHGWDRFRPYRYPDLPGCNSPVTSSGVCPPPIVQQQPQDMQCPSAAVPLWEVLLQVVILFILLCLCLSGDTAD